METLEYAKMMESKLIAAFREDFYTKLGYYPIVLTSTQDDSKGRIPLMSLESLEKFFTPFLPTINGVLYTLKTHRRHREIVELRMIYCYIARKLTYTLGQIGEYLGNRDHTTVIHNTKVFMELYESNELFREKYYKIINHITSEYEPSTMDHMYKAQSETGSALLPGLLPVKDSARQDRTRF